MDISLVKETLRDIVDFPKPGIIFKDITPVLASPTAYKLTLDGLETIIRKNFLKELPTKIVAIESRGFIFGAPLADRLGAGLVLARKPGKLPANKIRESFKLEYGEDQLEMHEDAINSHDRVIIIDDVLATGGTMDAATRLVERLGGKVGLILFLMEISILGGGAKIRYPYKTLL